jgi:hypothetical protein
MLFDLPIQKTKITRRGKFLAAGQMPHSYSILVFAMTKRKPGKFSVTKAVKANARERVGQPKPARVIETEPRAGRDIKHKPKLEEIIRQEE